MTNHSLATMNEDDARKLLGPNGLAVRDFILGLRQYPWFARVGQPEPWNHRDLIVRIHSSRRVWAVLPLTSRATFTALRSLWAIRDGLQKADPGSQWVEWCHEADYHADQTVLASSAGTFGEAGGKAAVWAAHAASELVLAHAVPDPPHFFLDSAPYWQQGHWPIGIREDGRLLVF